MSQLNLPENLVLNLTFPKVLQVIQVVQANLSVTHCQGQRLLVFGHNLKLCQIIQQMWLESIDKSSNNLEFKQYENLLKNGNQNLVVTPNDKIFTCPLSKSLELVIAAETKVEGSLLILSDELKLWIQFQPSYESLNLLSKQVETDIGRYWNSSLWSISFIGQSELIIDILKLPTLSALVSRNTDLQLLKFSYPSSNLRELYLQLAKILQPENLAPEQEEIVVNFDAGSPAIKEYSLPRSTFNFPWVGAIETSLISPHVSTLSSEQLQNLFLLCPIGVIYEGLDGGILRANLAFCRLVGYTETQLRHLDRRAISHREDFAAEVRLIKQMCEGVTQHITFRKRFLAADGCWVPVEISMFLVGDNLEESYLISFVTKLGEKSLPAVEISHQQNHQHFLNEVATLSRHNFDFNSLLKFCVEGLRQVLKTDRVLICQTAKQEADAILPAMKCIAFDVNPIYPILAGDWLPLDLLPPLYLNGFTGGRLLVVDNVQWAYDGGNHRQKLDEMQVRSMMTVGLVCKEKYPSPQANFTGDLQLNLWGILIVHHCQKPRRWLKEEQEFLELVAREISQAIQQNYQQKLPAQIIDIPKQKKEDFQVLREESNDLFVEYDLAGRYLYINPVAALLLNRPRAEIIGKTNQELGVLEADNIAGLLSQVFTTGQKIMVNHEMTITKEKRFFDMLYVPIFDEAKEVQRVIVTGHDVTDLRTSWQSLQQQNAQLTNFNRLKEEYIAHTSHELRTPLTAIIGFTSILLEQFFGALNNKQKLYLERIASSSQHLLDLINDILDLSRIEADKLELNFQFVVINEICEAVFSLIQDRITTQNLTWKLEIEPGLEFLITDARRLKQMLLNLLFNAIKFTTEGTVGLKVFRSINDYGSPMINFLVWDTGIGINPADQMRLFYPFSQIDSAEARRYQGTGLGLVITRKLAEIQGGSITVESEVGKGSRFQISLPVNY